MELLLVGKELQEAALREKFGVNVVGMWERGHFQLPDSTAMLNNHTVLLLAGREMNFQKYDQEFSGFSQNAAAVIIIELVASVGKTAKTLDSMNIPYRVIESDEKKCGMVKNGVLGDASHKSVLELLALTMPLPSSSLVITTNQIST